MDTQIKVGIDNEIITLEGSDAENVLNLQKEIQKDQDASENAAKDRVASLKASYQKFLTLGFDVSEVKVIFGSLGLSEEEIKTIEDEA